jgi:hypothetical protein
MSERNGAGKTTALFVSGLTPGPACGYLQAVVTGLFGGSVPTGSLRDSLN